MDLLTAFTLASSGLCFFGIAKDKNNKKYKIAGMVMLLASFISVLTYFSMHKKRYTSLLAQK